MIDWVTAEIRCDNAINSGCIAKLNEKGEVEWLSQSAMPVRGSYDIHMMVKPLSESLIRVSGNPSKWLQGHNLFGTNDLCALMYRCFVQLCEILEVELYPTVEQSDRVERGEYTVSRVDINESWELANQMQVKAWIRSAGDKMNMPHRGKGVFSGDTLYWGKGSKYWFMKCYSKGDEINGKKSNFPDELRTPQMLEYADKSLRLELVLCSKFLRETQLNWVYQWKPETAKMLLLQFVSKLEMSNNFMLNDDLVNTLPTRMRTAYLSWLHGADLRAILPKNTFYRYRREFKKYDIDISLVRDVERQESNVIPLIKVLEAKPMGIPEWAYEQGLVAC